MRDTTLLLTDTAVAADAFSANALNISKTPAEGLWLMITILRNHTDADEVLDLSVYGKDTDAAWAVDTTVTLLGKLRQIVHADVANGATIVRYMLIQTPLKFIKGYYDVGGTTPSWTINLAVCSGPDQKQTLGTPA